MSNVGINLHGIKEINPHIRHLDGMSNTIVLNLEIKTEDGGTTDVSLFWDTGMKHPKENDLKAMVNGFDYVGAAIREEAKKIYKNV